MSNLTTLNAFAVAAPAHVATGRIPLHLPTAHHAVDAVRRARTVNGHSASYWVHGDEDAAEDVVEEPKRARRGRKAAPVEQPVGLEASGAAAAGAAGTVILDVPGRWQYDQNNGYCGEVSIQMLMLRFGVWIPQETARRAGGGELLPGLNYDRALKGLHIAYDRFEGKGYQAFIAWAKAKLRAGLGVVTVAYIKGSRNDGYDHIMPMVGVKATPGGDVVLVNSNYGTKPIERNTKDYVCTVRNKKDGIERAGCVPDDTSYGYALRGPLYLRANAPRVELLGLSAPREPGLGRSVPMRATMRIRGLEAGKQYRVRRITELRDVPKLAGGEAVETFTATGPERTAPVTFETGKPWYYVCEAA